MPVSFEEEKSSVPQGPLVGSRGMSGFLVRKGLAANENAANLTLIIIALFATAIAIFFFFRGVIGPSRVSESGTLGNPRLETLGDPR